MKRRGTPIALFLVDQRMPMMLGTQLLVELRKLYPDAKKVLLTAYADTDAAIAAINDIGLHHYLMKPLERVLFSAAICRLVSTGGQDDCRRTLIDVRCRAGFRHLGCRFEAGANNMP